MFGASGPGGVVEGVALVGPNVGDGEPMPGAAAFGASVEIAAPLLGEVVIASDGSDEDRYRERTERVVVVASADERFFGLGDELVNCGQRSSTGKGGSAGHKALTDTGRHTEVAVERFGIVDDRQRCR
jgi:hypothetical protein